MNAVEIAPESEMAGGGAVREGEEIERGDPNA